MSSVHYCTLHVPACRLNAPATVYHAADVLAGAYAGRGRRGSGKGQPLVHAVEVDQDGMPRRVLCRRVALDHLTTDAAPTDRTPTCERCAARLVRLGATTSAS